MSQNRDDVKLVSIEGEFVVVDQETMMQSKLVADLLEDVDEDEIAQLDMRRVDYPTLTRVVEYCVAHATKSDPLDAFDQLFVSVRIDTLLRLLNAADFMNIPPMVQLCSKAVATHLISLGDDHRALKRFMTPQALVLFNK